MRLGSRPAQKRYTGIFGSDSKSRVRSSKARIDESNKWTLVYYSSRSGEFIRGRKFPRGKEHGNSSGRNPIDGRNRFPSEGKIQPGVAGIPRRVSRTERKIDRTRDTSSPFERKKPRRVTRHARRSLIERRSGGYEFLDARARWNSSTVTNDGRERPTDGD
ncbi:uncharacterized protein LOC143150606 [Ptiloglossa arizonensis]|uniref:uncharacterized protein LOC143150606 n=1 Tax=Ptiloglossa arizonensis TaxID=3350558 RepID=UPI003F9FD735